MYTNIVTITFDTVPKNEQAKYIFFFFCSFALRSDNIFPNYTIGTLRTLKTRTFFYSVCNRVFDQNTIAVWSFGEETGQGGNSHPVRFENDLDGLKSHVI